MLPTRSWCLALLACTPLGCANLPPGEACSDDGYPLIPALELRLVGIEYEVTCTTATEVASTIKFKISSGLWPALMGLVAVAAPFAVAQEAALAPEPTPTEMAIPRSRLKPATYASVNGDPLPLNSMGVQWAQFECGGIFEAEWCPEPTLRAH